MLINNRIEEIGKELGINFDKIKGFIGELIDHKAKLLKRNLTPKEVSEVIESSRCYLIENAKTNLTKKERIKELKNKLKQF